MALPAYCINPDLELIRQAIAAGGGPITNYATETTLQAVNDGIETVNETLIGIRTNTQTTADNTFSVDEGIGVADAVIASNVFLKNIAKGYTAPNDPAFIRYFVSTGSADLEDEVDEVMVQMNAELAFLGDTSSFNSANLAITNYLVGATVNFRAVVWVSFVI